MVTIPAGRFVMGAPSDEVGRAETEGPTHEVRIRTFAAGKFDVTRGQWATFVAATGRATQGGCAWAGLRGWASALDPEASWGHVGFPQGDDHPVVCVTWGDAQDYVRWLGTRTGRRYRLLTEAEWEYAARAGTTTPFPWGATARRERANYGAEVCCTPLAVGRDRWEGTSPAGAFPPNGFGLHDMHGNALQWVQDCYAPGYAGVPDDGSAYEVDVPLPARASGSAPVGRSCAYRMLRGGDWGDPPRMIRSAFRNYGPGPGATLEDYRSGGVTFRVARALP
jgi:formylglycine-generating enzyme required for sulfatase activity